MGRIARVREIMGLPPLAPEAMALAMEAGFDDMEAAARAIRARAAEHGLDPARIVLGGWSAGARCALYAAHAAGVECAGVVSLSGTMQPADLAAHLPPGRRAPPLLLVAAEHDLDSVLGPAEANIAALRATGAEASLVRVPGQDHWYPAEAATDAGGSVEAVMETALRRWMGR